jgi:cytochrome c oxidase assembly factor CtaG
MKMIVIKRVKNPWAIGLALAASLVVAVMVWWDMVRGVPQRRGLVAQAAAALGVICSYLVVERNKRPHRPPSETTNA